LSTASKARGAAACVTDGLVRDIVSIRKMKVPVFAAGIGPLDSKGRGIVAEIDVPVEVGGVRIEPGDLVFGDADGVVAIPKAIEVDVLKAALEKVLGEHKTLAALKRGEKLATVFARYGVL
jgi:regulator of RNase E activity RraA